MIGYGSFGTVMDALERAVAGGGYLAGERFTAADVYVGSQIGWGLRFATIEDRPGFADYWARVSDRDAYRRANALDSSAIRVGLTAGFRRRNAIMHCMSPLQGKPWMPSATSKPLPTIA